MAIACRTMARVAVLALLFVARSAQGDPQSEARVLLKEGHRLLDAGSYEAALDVYRTAYTRFPSPKILMNIGITLRHLSRNLEAADAFERCLADTATDAALRSQVTATLANVEQELARLTVQVDPADARVLVDGASVTLGDRASLRVAPGSHTVTAARAGYASSSLVAVLRKGETWTAVLKLLGASEETPAVTKPELIEEHRDSPRRQFEHSLPREAQSTQPARSRVRLIPSESASETPHERGNWPFVIGGAGLALIVGALVAGLVARSDLNQLAQQCAPDGSCYLSTFPDAQQTIDGERHAALTGDVLLGVGLLALAVGVGLLLHDPRPRSREHSWLTPEGGSPALAAAVW